MAIKTTLKWEKIKANDTNIIKNRKFFGDFEILFNETNKKLLGRCRFAHNSQSYCCERYDGEFYMDWLTDDGTHPDKRPKIDASLFKYVSAGCKSQMQARIDLEKYFASKK